MLRTEEEAKKCWCPFARVSCADGEAVGNHAANRFATAFSEGHERTRCIASECMAWRWGEWELAGTGEVSMSRFHNERQHPTRGVCGLAGSPAQANPGSGPLNYNENQQWYGRALALVSGQGLAAAQAELARRQGVSFEDWWRIF